MHFLVSLLVWGLCALFMSRRSLAHENLALRQQLAAHARTQKRPRLKPGDRAFWVGLSKVWRDWRSSLVLVKPATVIAWHRRRHQRHWTWRCGKPGRPPIPTGDARGKPRRSDRGWRDRARGSIDDGQAPASMPRPRSLWHTAASPLHATARGDIKNPPRSSALDQMARPRFAAIASTQGEEVGRDTRG
jgi:hypothetical protein